MSGHVGQRFLNDSKRMARDVVREPRKLLGVERDRNSGPFGGVLYEILDRGLEAQLVEHAGTQLAGNPAHDLHRFVDALRDRLIDGAELPGSAGALLGLLAEPRQVELERGERLAQLVVNLARDPSPLLFADRL